MPMGIREWGFTFFKGSECCYLERIGSVSFAILAEREGKCLVPLTLPCVVMSHGDGGLGWDATLRREEERASRIPPSFRYRACQGKLSYCIRFIQY